MTLLTIRDVSTGRPRTVRADTFRRWHSRRFCTKRGERVMRAVLRGQPAFERLKVLSRPGQQVPPWHHVRAVLRRTLLLRVRRAMNRKGWRRR